MDNRLALGFVLIVAGLLFLSSWPLFPLAGVSSYGQSVDAVSEDDVPSEAIVLQYQSLSTAGQRVVDEGPTGADNSITLHGEKPEAFEYTDARGVNSGIHYVRQGSMYYRVETYPGGIDVAIIMQMAFRVVAVVVGLAGVALYYVDSPAGVTVGLGLSALLLLGRPVYEQLLGRAVGWGVRLALLCAVCILSLTSPVYGVWFSQSNTRTKP